MPKKKGRRSVQTTLFRSFLLLACGIILCTAGSKSLEAIPGCDAVDWKLSRHLELGFGVPCRRNLTLGSRAREQFKILFGKQLPSGALPDVIWEKGGMVTTFTKPPVMAWAVAVVDRRSPDIPFLQEIYPKLIRLGDFWLNERGGAADGLFYYAGTLLIANRILMHSRSRQVLIFGPRILGSVFASIDLACRVSWNFCKAHN